MGDKKVNIEKALANTEMEIPIINCLSTPVKVHSNDCSFNNSDDTTYSKVITKHNDSH